MNIETVKIGIPDGCNVVIGGTHFIKSAEDLYEALAESSTGIKFGVAFNEASGKRLVRFEGNDKELTDKAVEAAKAIGCGHCFVAFIRNAFPINVLNRLKQVSEVTSIYCATANPVEVIVAQTEQGRAVLGVVDGFPPKGVEGEEDRKERKELMRKFGYKL